MSTNNKKRTERAQLALQQYVEAKGETFEQTSDEVCDLIADLLHLTRRMHLKGEHWRNTDQMLAMAQLHFDAEISDAEEEGEAV